MILESTTGNNIVIVISTTTLGVSLAILTYILKYHKIWIRLIDRSNEMWYDYCKDKGLKYSSLEGGSR